MSGYKSLRTEAAAEWSFTLIELVVVIAILGILVSFGLPSYHKTLEKVRGNEAVSQLKIIQAREKVSRLQTGTFVNCTDTDDCNKELRLMLPGDNWAYQVRDADANDFNATADRTGGTWDSCIYWINSTANITANNGNCVYSETEYWGG